MGAVKKVATTHRLRYLYTSGGVDTTDIAQATLISDASAGPLRDFLSAVTDDTTWGNLTEADDGSLSINLVPQAATNFHYGADFVASAPGVRVLRLGSNGIVSVRVTLEFKHSIVR